MIYIDRRYHVLTGLSCHSRMRGLVDHQHLAITQDSTLLLLTLFPKEWF
jgi:hypothetical protein